MSASDSDTTLPSQAEAPASIIGLAKRVSDKIESEDEPGSFGILATLWYPIGTVLKYIESCFSSPVTNDIQISLLARGGYNDVWLVKPGQTPKFILRVPNDDSLKPNQIQNEVGWLMYMSKKCPEVPVPAIYDYSDGSDASVPPFIAEQYIDAQCLSSVWSAYLDSEKELVAEKLARMIVRLGELRFSAIGGMLPDGTLGATVEGCKLFKGRDAFHKPACYDIGPYSSIKDYVLAYYDKEIYYHSHADDGVLDADLFADVTPAEFVKTLKEKRQSVEAELEGSPRKEPFVLCHNDLQGRNILMRGTDIAAVIDWEFAGAYPLSELNSDSLEVLEMEDEESVDECYQWMDKIDELIKAVAKEREWDDGDVQLLTGGGDPVLQAVRVEIIPRTEVEEEL